MRPHRHSAGIPSGRTFSAVQKTVDACKVRFVSLLALLASDLPDVCRSFLRRAPVPYCILFRLPAFFHSLCLCSWCDLISPGPSSCRCICRSGQHALDLLVNAAGFTTWEHLDLLQCLWARPFPARHSAYSRNHHLFGRNDCARYRHFRSTFVSSPLECP